MSRLRKKTSPRFPAFAGTGSPGPRHSVSAQGTWIPAGVYPPQAGRNDGKEAFRLFAEPPIWAFKIMRRTKVDEILLPYEDGVPLDPAVKIGERIITAIELMVGKNLKQIAVVRNQRPVGVVRLEDAFKKIGLTSTEARARSPQ